MLSQLKKFLFNECKHDHLLELKLNLSRFTVLFSSSVLYFNIKYISLLTISNAFRKKKTVDFNQCNNSKTHFVRSNIRSNYNRENVRMNENENEIIY